MLLCETSDILFLCEAKIFVDFHISITVPLNQIVRHHILAENKETLGLRLTPESEESLRFVYQPLCNFDFASKISAIIQHPSAGVL